MAIDVKPILHAGVAIQAAALAVDNAKLLKDKKITTKKITSQGLKNIVGIPLLTVQSQIIGGL